MSTQKVNHNVIMPFGKDGTDVDKSSGSFTTAWFDVNGWTDKVFTYNNTVTDGSGSISMTITADISPQHYYELNNKTATTEDYATITLASGVTGAVAARVDASDLDDLQRPWRSVRFKAVNGDATDNCTVTAYIEGWS